MSGASNGHSMEVTLPAIPDRLEPLFVRFRHWCRSIASPADSFAAELLLREALTNAVVHGCKCDPALEVSCRVRINSRRILIGVSDAGGGFDWRAPRHRDESAGCGRGIDILHLYGSRVRFNNKGNAAFILKRLAKEKSQMTNGDTEHV
ncbi:MAG: ATP-binding protein [Acidobacteria bacterium]|nr:ATP-binding protein [Acidobacteriota bacterium]